MYYILHIGICFMDVVTWSVRLHEPALATYPTTRILASLAACLQRARARVRSLMQRLVFARLVGRPSSTLRVHVSTYRTRAFTRAWIIMRSSRAPSPARTENYMHALINTIARVRAYTVDHRFRSCGVACKQHLPQFVHKFMQELHADGQRAESCTRSRGPRYTIGAQRTDIP